MQETIKNKKGIDTKTIAKIGMLAAISYILMFISVPLPIFPSFLKIDVSDIPAILGGFALGPVPGFIIVVIKNTLQAVTATTTGGIGEFANIIIGGSYVFILSMVYKYKKDIKGVLIGSILGIMAMTIVGCVVNYYVMLPLYGKMMGLDAIISMGAVINPRVNDLLSFVIWMIAPFNIVKGLVMSLCITPIYKKTSNIISKL